MKLPWKKDYHRHEITLDVRLKFDGGGVIGDMGASGGEGALD
jgi:hypothetical protein